jgi:lipoyl-dependent peroxiredoxin
VVIGNNEPRASSKIFREREQQNNAKEFDEMSTVKTSKATSSEVKSSKVQYTAKTHTTGGREGGGSRSDDGLLDVRLERPGSEDGGTNPEQLFAAGWSGCFLSSMRHVASGMKITVPDDVALDAEVDLCKGDDGYFLQARLNVSLPGLDQKTAQALIDETHKFCPYSKATRGNVNVAVNLVNPT